jgi:hypothetical protein
MNSNGDKMFTKSNQIYKRIDVCRLCYSKDLQDVLDLGDQPPANTLREKLTEPVPYAPLKIMRCVHCCAVQLNATVDPCYLFNKYVWVTSTSMTARNYSETYRTEVLNRSSDKLPFVVEIASNDGTFLKQFKRIGCQVLGVDPAQNIANDASKAGIPTLAQYFNVALANKIFSEYKRPNIVMARNVIPHVKEIHSIVEGMSTLVDEEGIVVIEFHYAKIIVEELHYDSIYHEHLFYFSIKTLTMLFEKYELYPYDVFSSPISGGSLVLFFSKQQKKMTNALTLLIEAEESYGLNKLSVWQNFGDKSKRHAKQLKSTISTYAKNETLIAYGASARSSTLLNFAKITNKEIEYVVDRSPIKHGLYTPGTNIPIISYEEGILKLKGKHLLLLAWNFEEEIVEDLRAIGFKGDIIVPLPNEIHIR